MTDTIRAIVFVPLVMLMTSLTPANAAAGDKAIHDWQLKRLFQPTEAQLQTEDRGQVFIYDGLTDKQVARAVSEQHHRMHAMMFTGVVKTDDYGEPLRDPATGEIVVEPDGCDY
ncbi:MAG: hypothetical protein JSW10_12615 [Pseudomonadota bacterium]|nr:MAG: hypothetical protein JSW10_12615 [Pseudomonadota bacterium]